MIFLSHTLPLCKILTVSLGVEEETEGCINCFKLEILCKVQLARTFRALGSKEKLHLSLQRHSCISRLPVSVSCVRQKANRASSLLSSLSSSLGDKVSVSVMMIKTLAFEAMGHIQRYGNLRVKSSLCQ